MRKIPIRKSFIDSPISIPKSRVLELNGPPQKIITHREYSDMLKGNWLPPSWV
jgi:hypothetical protein